MRQQKRVADKEQVKVEKKKEAEKKQKEKVTSFPVVAEGEEAVDMEDT